MALRALGRRQWNVWTAWALLLLVSQYWTLVSSAATPTWERLQPRAEIASGLALRVLPIGDSITWGAQSSDENGYRKTLYQKLAARGNNLDFVGGESTGSMIDRNHEGHRGLEIDEIRLASLVGIWSAPNIVLLHAGTNDMKNNERVSTAPERLKTLMNVIFKHNSDAVILVAQIIPASSSNYPATVPRIKTFNDAIPALVDEYTAAGKKVLMVKMNEALSTADLADGLHPNDGGYVKMANAWYDAIVAADGKNWITKAGKIETPPDSTSPENCRSTPSWYNVGQIATGAKVATTDGDFKPSWVKRGVVAEGACPRAQLHLMDLDGDGLKDYACVDPKTGTTTVHLNIPNSEGKTSGNWNKLGIVATGKKGRDGTGVMFADLNGDGRSDYIYVEPDTGDVFAWINRLEKDGVWQWQELGRIAGGVGATNDTLQMVDIDGDGRDDFCLVNPSTGEVTAWLNTGADVMPDYHKLGVIATGASATKADVIRLGDFTGEGRADYMIIGASGKVNGLVNRRQETTMVPRWLPAINIAAGPDGAKQDQVRLTDMSGDGKVDYLLIDEKTGKITLWENTGTGGKYQPGDGVLLCDLDGDGASDYFWVDVDGRGWGYLNKGKGKNVWSNLGMIADGAGYKREQIRMGTLTSSGRADYIVVDDETGRASWWQNMGQAGGWDWTARGVFATGPKNTIETKFGWKFRGKNVRFADLTGDGLDDYLYVNEQGAVVMWRNLGTDPPSWGLPYKVAEGVGVLPQDVQFADTNGDGKLDYVVVGRVTGQTRSWHHLGFRSDGSIRWNTPLSFADGTGSVGSAIKITDMTGEGRADYVSVDPDNGRLNLWKNRCWPLSDDGDPDDPDNPDDGGDGGDDDGGGGDDDDDDGDTYPIVTNGNCGGPDCKSGKCTGRLCTSFGCEGSDCSNGKCIGTNCTPYGCIGSNCKDGKCTGSGCKTKGCVGPHCDTGGGGGGHRCKGLSCVAIDCSGPLCGNDGKCTGPACSIHTCSGFNCVDGSCVGSGCVPGGGGGQDGGDDDSNDCETTTLSTCGTFCQALPTTTSCSSKCSEIEACTTNTDWTSTVTPAPAYAIGTMQILSSVAIPDTGLLDAAQSALSSLSEIGDFDNPPTSIRTAATKTTESSIVEVSCTQTRSTPYPTNTVVSEGTGYCYNSKDAPNCNDPPHRQFTFDDAEKVVDLFCSSGRTLEPDGDRTFAKYTNPDTNLVVYAIMEWAESQSVSRCGAKQKLDIGGSIFCGPAFGIPFFCPYADGDETESYGGGHVLVTQTKQGCVLVRLEAWSAPGPDISAGKLRARSGGDDGVDPWAWKDDDRELNDTVIDAMLASERAKNKAGPTSISW